MEKKEYTVQNDIGGSISFYGILISESDVYDEERNLHIIQRFFHIDELHKVYCVSISDEKQKEFRAYMIKLDNVTARIYNGLFDVTVECQNIIKVIHGLCGLENNKNAEMFFYDIFEDISC